MSSLLAHLFTTNLEDLTGYYYLLPNIITKIEGLDTHWNILQPLF